MKKEMILSALLLSQPLTPLNLHQALAADNGEITSGTFSSFRLVSNDTISYRGIQYKVEAYIDQDKDGFKDDDQVFELQGSISLRGKNEKNLQVGGGSDSDGHMMFERIPSNEKGIIKYRGYSCSSSFTGCEREEAGDIILEYNQANDSYSLTLDIRRAIEGWDSHESFEANTPLLATRVALTKKAAR